MTTTGLSSQLDGGRDEGEGLKPGSASGARDIFLQGPGTSFYP